MCRLRWLTFLAHPVQYVKCRLLTETVSLLVTWWPVTTSDLSSPQSAAAIVASVHISLDCPINLQRYLLLCLYDMTVNKTGCIKETVSKLYTPFISNVT